MLLAAGLLACSLVVAFILERRRSAPPTQPTRFAVPVQLDRDDFPGAETPWLVVVFTSAACDTCAAATAKASVLAAPDVTYAEIAWQTRKDLHERYGVEAVPCIVIADAEGIVRASFIGEPTATDLFAAIAQARDA